MKHLLRNLWIAALIVCCNFQQVSAQQLPPIPIDPVSYTHLTLPTTSRV